ncbi:MAG: hypothetical protein A3F17_00985 [Gammaproteobacteria bacterium RIFCSPHIGHO2_12_FULL_41_15]|nr:MAG: hypothetical protein A3F17_00985 [Gammaproteobacteria bacterium RIFCSPHIGHO2_12_FULL_41_15]
MPKFFIEESMVVQTRLVDQKRDSLSFLIADIAVNGGSARSLLLLFLACAAKIKLIPEEISVIAQHVSVLISPYLELIQYQLALNQLKQLIDDKEIQHIYRIDDVGVEIAAHHDKIVQLQPEFNEQLKHYRLAQLRSIQCDATLFQQVKTVYDGHRDQLIRLKAHKAHLEKELSALRESTRLIEQMQDNLKFRST